MRAVSNQNTPPAKSLPMTGLSGFIFYTLCLFSLILLLPQESLNPESKKFIFLIGILALWRYTWAFIHFARSWIYRKRVFPRLRALADSQAMSLRPSHVYLLVTSFRIDVRTTLKVYNAVINEAIHCGIPTTIVASIVELADEFMIKEMFYR